MTPPESSSSSENTTDVHRAPSGTLARCSLLTLRCIFSTAQGFITEKKFSEHGRHLLPWARRFLTPPSMPYSRRPAGQRCTIGDQNVRGSDRIIVVMVMDAQEGFASVVADRWRIPVHYEGHDNEFASFLLSDDSIHT